MSNLMEYLKYHISSTELKDIDPAHEMLRYLCDRFELNMEQRYWLAFVYAMTYCGGSTFYVYNEFPDFENVDIPRMQRWWDNGGREKILCQTDRRWVRSSSLFVPAVESYRRWIGESTQQEHFHGLTDLFNTPEVRYDEVYRSAKQLFSFGQFALFLYLEALHTITDLDLMPTDLDLSKAWSCRNGLMYAYERFDRLTPREMPTPPEWRELVDDCWRSLRAQVGNECPSSNVWNLETTLCAYRKFKEGKRYIGSYIDRQGIEIAKLEARIPDGVAWEVLWQFREETYDHKMLAEKHKSLSPKGVSAGWQYLRNDSTRKMIS